MSWHQDVSVRLSPEPKRPEQLGFYTADSWFAKMDGDFYADKKMDPELLAGPMAASHKANDVFDEHHKGRKWSMSLALMTLKTGAYRPLIGVKSPLGGYDEDGVDQNIPVGQIWIAKTEACTRRRVAARKMYAATTGIVRRRDASGQSYQVDKEEEKSAFEEEKKKIAHELWRSVGSPNLPTKQRQITPGSPLGSIMRELNEAADDDDDEVAA